MNNLLITMSGGTTSVINETLAGLILKAQKSNLIDKIYVGFPGIEGFLSDKVLNLTNLNDRELSILKKSPGSASIGTTRAKIFDDETLNILSEGFTGENLIVEDVRDSSKIYFVISFKRSEKP